MWQHKFKLLFLWTVIFLIHIHELFSYGMFSKSKIPIINDLLHAERFAQQKDYDDSKIWKLPIKRYSSQGNAFFTRLFVLLLGQPPVISLSSRLFKDSKQIDSHVNTAEVKTLPFCAGFEPLAACLLLFVCLRMKMNRINRKTNWHSRGHVKGEWRPLVSPHTSVPLRPSEAALAYQCCFVTMVIYLADVYLVCVGIAIRHFVRVINGFGALAGCLTIETST